MDDTRDNAERARDHAEQAWKERLNRYREAAQRGNLGPEVNVQVRHQESPQRACPRSGKAL
jgi:hypothetical protein